MWKVEPEGRLSVRGKFQNNMKGKRSKKLNAKMEQEHKRKSTHLLPRQHLPILLIKLPDMNHLHALKLRDLNAAFIG